MLTFFDRLTKRQEHAPRDEQGFTLIELTLAAALMMLIIGAFGLAVATLFGAETNSVAGENASSNMRSVVTLIQGDIESAVPNTASPIDSASGIDLPSSVASANLSLQLELGAGGSQKTVTWTYSPTAGTLTRSVASSPTASPTITVTELTGVINACSLASCTTPIFNYYGQNGEDLIATGSATSATIANCAVRVQVTLQDSAGKNSSVPEQKLDTQLSNTTPGDLSCG